MSNEFRTYYDLVVAKLSSAGVVQIGEFLRADEWIGESIFNCSAEGKRFTFANRTSNRNIKKWFEEWRPATRYATSLGFSAGDLMMLSADDPPDVIFQSKDQDKLAVEVTSVFPDHTVIFNIQNPDDELTQSGYQNSLALEVAREQGFVSTTFLGVRDNGRIIENDQSQIAISSARYALAIKPAIAEALIRKSKIVGKYSGMHLLLNWMGDNEPYFPDFAGIVNSISHDDMCPLPEAEQIVFWINSEQNFPIVRS